jgi:hypothetical protein
MVDLKLKFIRQTPGTIEHFLEDRNVLLANL